MVSRVIAVDPFDFVAFGGTGDLVRRKLLPGLYHRDRVGQIPPETRIIGAARTELDPAAWRDMARQAIEEHVDADEREPEHVDRFLARLDYVAVDARGEAGWAALAERLASAPERIRVFYLATGPDLFGDICRRLGVGGRAGYYDKAGALRDMVQNHILQLLCLVAMEPPASLDADAVRDEKLKVLKALKRIDGSNAANLTVRGQYVAGAAEDGPVPGYLEELGSPTSRTETFVALEVGIENWRWAGTPFYLRSGKRMAQRVSEIVVSFRPIPHSVFDEAAGPIARNELVIRLQPDEGVKLQVMLKDPGPGGMRLRRVPLDMSFAEAFATRHADAYERLVMDVVRGNQTLFMRRDEVEAAWTWIDPILEAWTNTTDGPKSYRAGTWGPSASIALVERAGRTWHEDGM